MKYFLDTEFIEGFHKPLFGKKRHFIDLISIGIISEDGREYQALSNEFNPKDADEWVKTNVLWPIEERFNASVPGFVKADRGRFTLKEIIDIFGKSNKQIAKEIVDFVNPKCLQDLKSGLWPDMKEVETHNPDKYGNAQPEFYGYYADYDWVLFCSLFGRMIDLPKGFPMYCKDLKQLLDEKAMRMTSKEATALECPSCEHDMYDYLEKTTDGSYKINVLKNFHPDFPKQSNEHDALADAKWNKELYYKIINP